MPPNFGQSTAATRLFPSKPKRVLKDVPKPCDFLSLERQQTLRQFLLGIIKQDALDRGGKQRIEKVATSARVSLAESLFYRFATDSCPR